MSKLQDRDYLQGEQYHNAEKLNARIALHTRFSTNSYGWFRWVFDHFEFVSKARILELGCGPGDLWLQNADRLPKGGSLTLSDFSIGMVCQARHNLGGLPRRFAMSIIDCQEIPFERSCFDVVIANHFLYHVPNQQKALSEIHRVLKPGGRLYSTTIGETHLQEISDLVARFDPSVEDVFKSDQRPFTLENGRAQIRSKFTKVELDRYPDSLLVTEVQPLVDYILSTVRFDQVASRRKALTAFITAQMEAGGGAINVKKESGLFTAVKDETVTG